MRRHGMVMILFLLLAGLFRVAGAEEFRLGVREGDVDIFDYEISVLRLALAHAPGEHRLEIVSWPSLAQNRMVFEVEQGDSSINVFFIGFDRNREKDFLQVDIPITRGLLGHRIFIIRKQDRARFAGIETLDQMKAEIVIGSGMGWPDTTVFQSAGFRVTTGLYASLWRMLDFGRFDAFNRGVHEAPVEMEKLSSLYPDLTIDDSLMVVYRFDYFFYVLKTYPELHATITAGLKTAYEDGSFMKNFRSHPAIRKVIDGANLPKRRVFLLDNPQLSERVKAIPEKYWERF